MSYHERLKLIKLGMLPKEAVAKQKKPIAKISEKKKQADKNAKDIDGRMDLWFEARRLEMTGRCVLCGGKTEKDNDEAYRRSVAHLLPKRKNAFPSISTHPDNWLELCFYGNSCHTNFDNGVITWELLHDSKEWDIIKRKFISLYPFIHPDEHKNIPEILLKTITNE